MICVLPLCAWWRKCIGCLKLQVSFRKRATNFRAVLRKMTSKIRHPVGLRHTVTLCTPRIFEQVQITYSINVQRICACVFQRVREGERQRARETESLCKTFFFFQHHTPVLLVIVAASTRDPKQKNKRSHPLSSPLPRLPPSPRTSNVIGPSSCS